MKKTRRMLLFATLCAAVALGGLALEAQEAFAQSGKASKSKTNKTGLDAVLGKLSWGMSHDKVINSIEAQVMEDFQAKARGMTDLAHVDMLMKTRSERINDMRQSYIVLHRDNVASLSVSIVGEEFMPDNEESMLVQKEDNATKYFFFFKDKLYKLAIVYDSNYIGSLSFPSFVATVEQKYGPFSEDIWSEEGDFLEAHWRGASTFLNVKNKSASYGTFLMVFSLEALSKELSSKQKAYYDSVNSGPVISDAINLVTEGNDDFSTGGSSIDAMLGKKTEVNLLAGLSQEDIDVIEGKVKPKEEEKGKKSKSKRKDKSKKTNAKAKAGLEIF